MNIHMATMYSTLEHHYYGLRRDRSSVLSNKVSVLSRGNRTSEVTKNLVSLVISSCRNAQDHIAQSMPNSCRLTTDIHN